MSTTKSWLPLFPLDLALLPGALLPLHVFEPRYRALTRRSLEGDRRFGIVRMRDGELARVGCTARIVEVLEAYPDGRSDILVRGEERFSWGDLREHAEGYLEARTDAVRDDSGPGPDAQDRLLLERLFRDYARLAEEGDLLGGVLGTEPAGGSPGAAGEPADEDEGPAVGEEAAAEAGPALPEGATAGAGADPHRDADGAGAATTADADRFSFVLAARMPLDVDERQALLATLSERERTLALLGHLARLVPRMRAHEKDRRKVRGNGKLVPTGE